MQVVAYDNETHLSQPGLAAPPIVCTSVANHTGCHLLDRTQGIVWLRKILSNPLIHIVGCNLAYDMVCAAVEDLTLLPLMFQAYDDDRIHDVAIREALMDIGKGELVDRGEEGIGIRYGLGLLVQRYFGLDLSEEKKGAEAFRRRYASLEGIPLELWPWAARVYPLRDVAFPLEIFHRQEGGQNLHDEPNQCRAAFALALMSARGVRTNRDTVAALRARVEAEDRRVTLEFQACGILREDGTENKTCLRELVTAAYGDRVPMTARSARYPRGQIATDRDTLAESGDPLLEKYATAGKNDKYLSTYLPILEGGVEQPWNPQFNVLVATTRVSSDAQQFPQSGGVRECFEARPDFVYCSVDYGGLELRTMAQRAIWEVGYSRMAEVLNSGQDPHLIAAASFMGVPYEDALARYKAGDKVVKAFRDLGKIWNFGKGGGMGPAAMVYNARIDKNGARTTGPDGVVYIGSRFCLLTKEATKCGQHKEIVKVRGVERRICSACLKVAKRLDAGWLKAWPEQQELFNRASKLAKSSRNLTAKIPVSNVVRGKCGYTQWLNTPFQGLGAAATKRAMWIICRESYTDRKSPLWNSRLVLNIHDELLAELVASKASAAGDRMALIMRETLKEFVPDLAASVEADPALSRTMAKGAKTIRDSNGVLQVWSV